MKTKFIVIALVLALALATVVPLHAAQTQPILTIEVERLAVLGQWGVVHVTDYFTIHNNGTQSVSSLDFGYSRVFRDTIYYVVARDKQGRTLALDGDLNQTSGIYWMRAHFAQPLSFNATYEFTATTILSGVITKAPGGFQYNFTAAPVLTQDAKFANATFVASQGSTFAILPNSTYRTITLNGQPAIVNEYTPWKAYSDDVFFAPYRTVNQYLLDLTSANRNIVIKSTGGLSVADTYRFHNNGIQITSLPITLPDGASNVMAYDVVGAMWAIPQNPVSPYQVTVSPRYSAGIRGNENFTFTLTYDVPAAKYLKQLNWWGNYNLTFGLFNNQDDFLFDNVTVTITAPNGVSFNDVKLPTQSPVSSPIQYDPVKHVFALKGVTSLDNVTFAATVNYIPFLSGFGALPWLFGVEVAIAAFALAVKVRRGPELEVPVPVERLREFVGLYDERLALTRELVLMEEEVARGGLVKHEFRRRTKVMELRLDEINKSLMAVKNELRSISARYDDLIRRIDRAEAEIEVSRNSMSQVRSQYRAGKTTRETFDSLINDITKRIDRAEETVETILITLREEAR